MARVTIEDCLDAVDNRFALVMLAARRARQLENGAGAHVDAPKNKSSVRALREIAAGKIGFEDDLEELLAGWTPTRGAAE